MSPKQAIKLGPGYQVPFARAVKQATRMPAIAVGLITEPEQAEAILAAGDADAVAIARAALLRSALAMACGGEARRAGRGAEAILALAAARAEGFVRRRGDQPAVTFAPSLCLGGEKWSHQAHKGDTKDTDRPHGEARDLLKLARIVTTGP